MGFEDDTPRDSLGRRTRRKRYTERMHSGFTPKARQQIEDVAAEKGWTPAKFIRDSTMKQLHIYLANKRRREQA